MDFYIHKNVLGTSAHVSCDINTGKILLSSKAPCELWSLGDRENPRSIEALALGVCQDLELQPPQRFVNAMSELDVEDAIPWEKVLPRTVFKQYLQNLIQSCSRVLTDKNAISYKGILEKSQKAFSKLQKAKIDHSLWSYYLVNSHDSLTLESFFPDQDGFAACASYLRESSTGRMTTKAGPKILHLDKNYRNMIKSRHARGGKIMQIDFVSMEPRILAACSGVELNTDIYSVIRDEVLHGNLTRDEVKIVVMAILYGAGKPMVQAKLGTSHNASQVIEDVRRFLNVHSLEKRLSSEVKVNNGVIKTHYNRVVTPNRLDPGGLVSYFTQGTGVDLALLGFLKGIEFAEANQLKITPIFFIHDAMLVDVHPDVTEYDLQQMCDVISQPDDFSVTFPVGVKECY